MARLIMLRGPEPGKVYELNSEIVQIGRGRRNTIIVHDNEVSREHCRLVMIGGDYELQDLASSNGTFVNGQRVTDEGWVLKSNCIIEIGDTITFEFQVEHTLEDDATPSLLAQPYLVVKIKSQADAEVYPLEGEHITLGRDLTCDIVVQEPEVSRQHLALRFSELGYMVEDLGSTNGTLLNGEPLVIPRLLHLNDVMQIGTMVQLAYTDDPATYVQEKGDLFSGREEDETLRKKMIDDSELLHRIKLRTDTSDLGIGFEPGALVGAIFIAYARSEWASAVAGLYTYLEDRRLNVWVDQYLTRGASDWEIALEHVLTESRILVIVVSKAAMDTDYVKRAWRYFHSREKPIILVMYERVERLPLELNSVPTVPYNRQDPTQTYEDLIAEIMRTG